jgi:protein-S-isoprenylcysteine O-methyltransferase Ste14
VSEHLYRIGIMVIAVVALQRAVAIHYFFFRRFLAYRKGAVAAPASWKDLITYPEPPLLIMFTAFQWISHPNPVEPSIGQLVRVGLGDGLSVSALGLQIWALRSLPGVSPGHYVLPEQQVVTGGAYGFVRHPLYLQAIIVWLSIALGFSSPAALLIALLYVIPAYIIFSRSEEEMMLSQFGEAYRDYRESVGALFPRWWRRRS